jgi:hypothetical protein
MELGQECIGEELAKQERERERELHRDFCTTSEKKRQSLRTMGKKKLWVKFSTQPDLENVANLRHQFTKNLRFHRYCDFPRQFHRFNAENDFAWDQNCTCQNNCLRGKLRL